MSGQWPRWSPDGALLAWIAHNNEGSFDGIVVYDLEAGDDHLITGVSGVIEWSPDGAWIAVAMPERDLSGNETGAGGLYVMRPDGSETVLLQEVQVDEFDVMLDWSGVVPPS
jgi:Tol biopolymer transport system component